MLCCLFDTVVILELCKLRRVVYLALEPADGIGLEFKNHECPRRDYERQPNAEGLRWDKAKARVVLGMPHDDDYSVSEISRSREAPPNKG